MVQHVKDPVLSLQQLVSLLWHEFDPWPGNFHMPQAWPHTHTHTHTHTRVRVYLWTLDSILLICMSILAVTHCLVYHSFVVKFWGFVCLLCFFFSSKQSLYHGKANSSQGAGRGKKSSPSLLSNRGFYLLKMGVSNVGSRKMWFSSLGLAQLPISVLVQ